MATLHDTSVWSHMLILGVAVFAVGELVGWLLPELSLWWVVGTVYVIAHLGLITALGGAAMKLLHRGSDSD